MKPPGQIVRVFLLFSFLTAASILCAQNAGKEQPGAMVERFKLRNGRVYEGIWDAKKPQIHLVVKTNHVGNLSVTTNEVVKRDFVREGGDIRIFGDLEMAEKVVLSQLQVLKAAKGRVGQAIQNRDKTHAFYHGKTLPKAQYNAVMVQYKQLDDAVANAEKAMPVAQAAFEKACENYEQLGGKTNYRSQAQ
jgi:hypothetical protein